MKRTWSLVILRIAALICIGFSAALAIDYYGGSPTFCGANSACASVRNSNLGRQVGMLLPALGMSTYFSIFLFTFSSKAATQRYAGYLASLCALGAAGLIAAQAAVIKAFCWLCMCVDTSAIVAGVAGAALVALSAGEEDAVASSLPSFSWWVLCAGALGLAPVWAKAKPPPPVPPFVGAQWKSGKLNVVEFSDFQCPFCRQMHPVLEKALKPYGEKVHFVRRSYPLPFHTGAMPAAKAYNCARAQGRDEAMADELFKLEDLTEKGIATLAKKLKLDRKKFAACFKSEETKQGIEGDMAKIRESGLRGLPTVWIGDKVFVGFDISAGEGQFDAALKAAAAGQESKMEWPWLVGFLVVIGAGFGVGIMRQKRASEE